MDINDQNAIEIEQIQEGLVVLNSLAQKEYQEDLDGILADTPHHLRGLDKPCFMRSNPHRESGTRFGLRQTLEQAVGGHSWEA